MIHRTLSDGVLIPSSELTSRQVRDGVAAMDADLKGGPQKEINAAILELLGATDRPPKLDEASEAARILALKQMAWDYPVDVVKRACREWRKVPNYGRWWPTEQDLRAQCEPLVEPQRSLRNKARVLQMQLEAQEDQAERERQAKSPSAFAGDTAKQFRSMMQRRMNQRRFETYFHASELAFVGENEIFVRTQTTERVLREEGGDIAKRLGITIHYRPKAFMHIRHPQWEDDTIEEREETTRKFNRLVQAMQKGEDIKALRKSGVL